VYLLNFSCPCRQNQSDNTPIVTTEKFKLLKVIGETLGQVVAAKTIPVITGRMKAENTNGLIEVIKIDHLHTELRNVKDVLYKNKVIKQGTIQAQIFYVNFKNAVMYTAIDIPFTLVAEIPGLEPNSFTEVQNHLVDITPQFQLTPGHCCKPGTLEIKVVAHILTVVSEWVQRNVITDEVHLLPKTKLAFRS
jgi:hypothetical protein